MNVGEQLVSSYLRHLKGCEFIQTNLYTIESQGEIDVVGINLKEKKFYICKVVIHLTTGLQYVKNKRPNNVSKLVEKFTRDIAYARSFLADYEHEFILWSPIVRDSKGSAVYNQVGHLAEIHAQLLATTGLKLTCVVNEDFFEALKAMRVYAGAKTEELKCPLMRLIQIEELLARHVSKRAAGLSKRKAEVLEELLEGPAIGQG